MIGFITPNYNDQSLRFRTNGAATTVLTMLDSGNVGIGTTSPNDALEVAGNSATTHRIRINNANASGTETLAFVQGTTFKSWVEYNNSNGNFDIWQYTNNDLRFGTNNTERIRITSAGNVGIGTTNPVAALNIGNNGNIRIDGNASGGGIYASSNGSNNTFSLTRQDGVNVGDLSISGYSGVGITGGRGSSPATSGYSFYVKSDGNVGIGTTSPGYKLTVNGDVDVNNGAILAAQAYGINLGVSGYDIVMPTTTRIAIKTSGSERVSILNTGNVGIGTTNPLSQLSIGSNAITTKKPTVIIADGVAGGSLVIRGLSPILSFDRTGASPENKILMDGVGLEFKTGSLDAEGDVDFKIKLDGKLQAPAYTQGFLQSDANGNIEISGGGTLPGGPYLPLAGGIMTGNIVLNDNVQLQVGSSGDLRIYHDGSNSYINDVGSGSLIIKSSTIIEMKGANNEYLARFIEKWECLIYIIIIL